MDERERRVDPRRRPGRKIPCYYVHIRRPYEIRSLRFPHEVTSYGEDVRKPAGHKYCKTVQEAYALAEDTCARLDKDITVEIRGKFDGQDKPTLLSIKRGRLGLEEKGFRALGVDKQVSL